MSDFRPTKEGRMDYQSHLDPELRIALENVPKRDDFDVSLVDQVRAEMSDGWPRATGRVRTEESWLNRSTTDQPLRLVVNRPHGQRPPQGVLLWIHGGGYMLGAPEMDQIQMEEWALEHNCVVVSPDYRLAPENCYPDPFEDCKAGLLYAEQLANEMDFPVGRVVVGGISAGAGLAAAVTNYAMQAGTVIAGQVLLFPMIDDRFAQNLSNKINTTGWTSRANYIGWRSYLGYEPGGAEVPVSAAPSRAKSFSGLPHTFIAAGDLDIMRDEAISYMCRMVADSVPVEFHLFHGGSHGFIVHARDAEVSHRLSSEIEAFLDRCFQIPSTAW
jgi:acetyl esterase/lipase